MTTIVKHRVNLSGARALVLFDRGRAVPRSDTGLMVALIGEKLAREPAATVQVVGHANMRESARSAQILGMKRAQNVASALVAFGAGVDQVHVNTAGARTPAVTRCAKS